MSLYTELQVLIDEVQGPIWWGTAQLYDALNVSQEETFTYLRGFALASAPITFTSGTDLFTFNTASFMIPQYLIDTNTNEIFVSEHARLEDYSPNWKNYPPSAPKFVILWDSTHLRVWPQPDKSYTYTMYGVPWPIEIASGNLDLAADPNVRQAIIHRAASRLLEFTQPEIADSYETQAVEHERRYFRQLRNAGGANTWRLAPSRGWQVGQLGDVKIANKYW